jgi:hypothetical protein
MPCTTIIIRHSAPSVSIIADAIESVLSLGATTTLRRSKKPIAISGQVRLISTLPRCAHPVSLPPAPSRQNAPCDREQSP